MARENTFCLIIQEYLGMCCSSVDRMECRQDSSNSESSLSRKALGGSFSQIPISDHFWEDGSPDSPGSPLWLCPLWLSVAVVPPPSQCLTWACPVPQDTPAKHSFAGAKNRSSLPLSSCWSWISSYWFLQTWKCFVAIVKQEADLTQIIFISKVNSSFCELPFTSTASLFVLEVISDGQGLSFCVLLSPYSILSESSPAPFSSARRMLRVPHAVCSLMPWA